MGPRSIILQNNNITALLGVIAGAVMFLGMSAQAHAILNFPEFDSASESGEESYVVLYDEIEYGGLSHVFMADDTDLRTALIGNDAASSLRIVGDTSVTLYEHTNFSGIAEAFDADDPDLSDNVIGSNEASSLRVGAAETISMVGCSLSEPITINMQLGLVHSQVKALQSYLQCLGYLPDTVTLVTHYGVATTDAVRKYQQANNISALGIVGPQTRAALNAPQQKSPVAVAPESVEEVEQESEVVETVPEPASIPEAPVGSYVALYEHANFGGLVEYFTEDVFDLRGSVVGNDNVSSLKVVGDISVQLYEHIQYGGGMEVFVGDDINLTNNAIKNDNVSSLKIVPGKNVQNESAAEPEQPASGDCKLTEDITVNMDLGLVHPQVQVVQKYLQCLGHFPQTTTPTNYFGPVTKQAVTEYQKANSISAIGRVGPQTRAVLNGIVEDDPVVETEQNNESEASQSDPEPIVIEVPVQKCTTPATFDVELTIGSVHAQVLDLELLLQCLGFYPESVLRSTHYSATTRQAVRNFQADHGLVATGIIDAETRGALNGYRK